MDTLTVMPLHQEGVRYPINIRTIIKLQNIQEEYMKNNNSKTFRTITVHQKTTVHTQKWDYKPTAINTTMK